MKTIKTLIRKWQRKTSSAKKSHFLGFKVEETKIGESNSYFLIQDRIDYSIPFTVTHYLSDYSTINKSPKTIKNIADALTYLYSFTKSISLNLNMSIVDGNTLELKQIEQLRDFIRSGGDYSNIRVFNKKSTRTLSLSETNRLMSLIKGYLRWGLDEYCSKGANDKIAALERKFKSLQFSVKRDNRIRVVNPTCLELLEKVFALTSESCWKNPISRLRNHCMFGIALETGARISEILGLYIGDFSTGSSPLIYIIKRDNNKNDPRKTKARVKTFSRSIVITNELHNKIINYISARPGKNNLFLFLAHEGPNKGKPLSLRRAHALMEDVNRFYKEDPLWKGKINWHDVRHTALYRFYWDFEGEPDQKQMLKDIGGHISDSVFARYHQLAIAEKAQKILRKVHEDQVNRKPKPSTHTSDIESEISLEDLI